MTRAHCHYYSILARVLTTAGSTHTVGSLGPRFPTEVSKHLSEKEEVAHQLKKGWKPPSHESFFAVVGADGGDKRKGGGGGGGGWGGHRLAEKSEAAVFSLQLEEK